jgi:hypothetical protein
MQRIGAYKYVPCGGGAGCMVALMTDSQSVTLNILWGGGGLGGGLGCWARGGGGRGLRYHKQDHLSLQNQQIDE